ncbi:type I restriction enzyme S subunit [Marinobacter nauticus]|uniref:Type I restriction enzyme S subunit n=1 Tax=Marinobacter nauticus TaxID=2743 RepID=A0A368XIS7_MARNT|nr:restriction endonuclease subunit S [Marinobacter nauticus]RCW67725.1 type I restriction enzyme S subunit [Marinobacter nauticus]
MTDAVTPPQWLTVPLENVILRIVGGGTPSKSKPEYYQGEIPWMSVKDMNKHVLQDTADHISQAAVDNSSTNVIPAGTPIVATRMSLGKIVVADFDSAINQDLKALFLPAEVHRDYLVYWYRSVARKIEQMGTGTTVKGIRLEALKGLDFALPPLAEQKVIADKLDTLLAQVENTKARLERIPQILKRFRQSVLAAAVSGRLTEEWRGSSDLIGWEAGELGRFVEKPRYGSSAKSQKSGDVPVLRMGNLQDGKLDWADLVYTSDLEEIEKYRLETGDVLFNRTNSPELVGKTSIFRGEREAIYAGYLIKIKCLPGLNPEFLNYQLNSPKAKDYCKAVKSDGVSQSNINAKKLAAYPLHCPPPEEQAEIVRQVDQLFAHADRIEQQVNNALARVNNLTQSILAKAFRGELTAQWRKDNPELISGENSAEALLERIKAERAAVAKPKRGKAKA